MLISVVKEIQACCHHYISLRCPDKQSKIAIIQARYVADQEKQESVTAAVLHPLAGSSSSFSSLDYSTDHQHHPFIPSSRSIS
jgi:hypothetical protein